MDWSAILYGVGGALLGWLANRFNIKLPKPSPPPATPVPAPDTTDPLRPCGLSPAVYAIAKAIQERLDKRQETEAVEAMKEVAKAASPSS